jgi:hypothetical protein
VFLFLLQKKKPPLFLFEAQSMFDEAVTINGLAVSVKSLMGIAE